MCSVTQSCPTLCDPMDHQAPLSMGILQARILERAAISSSRDSSQARGQNASLESPALAGGFFTTSTNWETRMCVCVCVCVCAGGHACVSS